MQLRLLLLPGQVGHEKASVWDLPRPSGSPSALTRDDGAYRLSQYPCEGMSTF